MTLISLIRKIKEVATVLLAITTKSEIFNKTKMIVYWILKLNKEERKYENYI